MIETDQTIANNLKEPEDIERREIFILSTGNKARPYIFGRDGIVKSNYLSFIELSKEFVVHYIPLKSIMDVEICGSLEEARGRYKELILDNKTKGQ